MFSRGDWFRVLQQYLQILFSFDCSLSTVLENFGLTVLFRLFILPTRFGVPVAYRR